MLTTQICHFPCELQAQTQIRCFMLSSFVPPIPPEGTFRRSIYDLCTSTWFEPLVNIAIVANVVVLAMETVPRNEKLFEVTDLINSACLYVFTVDVVFRCYAFSPKVYIKENWNKLVSSTPTFVCRKSLIVRGSTRKILCACSVGLVNCLHGMAFSASR